VGQLEENADVSDFCNSFGDSPMVKTILVATGGSGSDLVLFETALAVGIGERSREY